MQRVYDELGRVTKLIETNAKDEQTWQSYEYVNPNYPMQPTLISRPSVVEGRTAQVKLRYDEYGNVVSMTEVGYRPATINKAVEPLNRITKYHYELINGKSLLTAVDGPLSGTNDTTRYHYDSKNQIVSIVYPEGLTQNMSYDQRRRLVRLKDIDGSTSTYQYDAKGRVTQTNQNGQTTTISYDPMGRIAQITDP